MKKRLAILAFTVAIASLWAGMSAVAFAHPSKPGGCDGCHGTAKSLSVKATLLSNTGGTANYKVDVTSPGNLKGWAVIGAGKNIANAVGASGTFSVPAGKTYDVWAVDPSDGARMITIAPAGSAKPQAPTYTASVHVTTVVKGKTRNVASAMVVLKNLATGKKYTKKTTTKGVAALKKLPQGSYSVQVLVKGQSKYSAASVSVTDNITLDISI
jgi:hypothetical protein